MKEKIVFDIAVFYSLLGVVILLQILDNGFQLIHSCNNITIHATNEFSPRLVPRQFVCADICLRDISCKSIIFRKPNYCYINDGNMNMTCHANDPNNKEITKYYRKICLNGGLFKAGRCTCINGYIGTNCERIMEDCADGAAFYPPGIFDIFLIQPKTSSSPFRTPCKMKFGNRLIIASNYPGGLSFRRDWKDYRNGFHDEKYDSFWLGNAHLHTLTSNRKYDLFIQFTMDKSWVTFAIRKYIDFEISNEENGFEFRFSSSKMFKMSGMQFTDCLEPLNGSQFSTYDRDNDESAENCADKHGTGWWFKSCSPCNPLGKLYLGGNNMRLGYDEEFFWDCGLEGQTPYRIGMWLQRSV